MITSAESLVSGVSVIQQEKKRLEKKLQDVRSDRLNLERTKDSVAAKCSQVKDVHAKMSETLKVAQHKVTQTQSIMEAISADNERRRQRVDELHRLLTKSEEGQFSDINNFQDALANLAQKMIAARTFYSAESLSNEVANLKPLKSFENDVQILQDEYFKVIQELNIADTEEKKQQLLMGNISVLEQVEASKAVTKAAQGIAYDTETLQKLLQDLEAQNKIDQHTAMDCD